MKQYSSSFVVLAALALMVGAASASAQEKRPADVGEKVSFEGTYVRLAANDEGWVSLGFRLANESVGQEWMLLEVGATMVGKKETYELKRSDIALVIPGPSVVQLATQEEYGKAGHLIALNRQAQVAKDNINYFPAGVGRIRTFPYFTNPGQRGLVRDTVELNDSSAVGGRLYFHVPGGIKLGTYNLDVKFKNSTIKVPFQIMTKDETKALEKNLKNMKKK